MDQNTKKEQLNNIREKINEMRNTLNEMLVKDDIEKDLILELSRKLDSLIAEFYVENKPE